MSGYDLLHQSLPQKVCGGVWVDSVMLGSHEISGVRSQDSGSVRQVALPRGWSEMGDKGIVFSLRQGSREEGSLFGH